METNQSDLGMLYVLSNPALAGLVKIGFTKQGEVRKRVLELSNSSSIPLPFNLEHDVLVENPQQYERLIHARLTDVRINPQREFFAISPEEAIDTINDIVYGTTDVLASMKRGIEMLCTLYKKYPDRFSSDDAFIENLEMAMAAFEGGLKMDEVDKLDH